MACLSEVGDIAMLFWSMHGSVCSLTVILVNKAFRNRVIRNLRWTFMDELPPIVPKNNSWLYR